MRFVLDTNIVIAALSGSNEVAANLGGVPVEEVGIPLVVVAELLYGARRSRRVDANLARVEQLRATFPVLPLSDDVVDRYGRVRAALEASGLSKSDFDLLIACTALVSGAALVTHDTALKDGSIIDLVVEDWLEASRDT